MTYALVAHTVNSAKETNTTTAIDTSGADLLVLVVGSNTANPGTISDTYGNTWTSLTASNAASAARSRIWYCRNPLVGPSHTFTLTGATNMYGGIAVLAFAGSGTSGSIYDGAENGATGSATTTLSTGSVIPSVDNGLLVFGSAYDTTNNVSSVNVGTLVDALAGVAATSFGNASAYEAQTTATSRNPQFTYAGSVGPAARIAAFIPAGITPRFTRNGSTPVLAKGSAYGGWTADALAAPSVCWDGSQYVMTVSLWSVANSKWASAFFTSPNLSTWSYVTNSLWVPAGSDYILGNAGIAWFGGKYWFAYNHYVSGSPAAERYVGLAHSTDLLTWTVVSSSHLTDAADLDFSINPGSGKLELWYIKTSDRTLHMEDSPDGSTWTDRGQFLATPSWATYNFGEPSVFYRAGARYLLVDASVLATGYRFRAMLHSDNQDVTWVLDGTALSPAAANAWESGQVFDDANIFGDIGDGNGNTLHMLYAGSDSHSPGDNTNSSIGLATNRSFLLSSAVPLAGDAAAVAAANAALSVSVPLAGAGITVATASGAMSVSIPLAGSADGVASATGDLTATAGGVVDLAAAATATANATGGLSLSIPLSGSAVAQALAQAGITHGVSLTGAAPTNLRPMVDYGNLGGWVTNLGSFLYIYQAIDEITPDDSDYITSAGATVGYSVSLSNPGTLPASGIPRTTRVRAWSEAPGAQLRVGFRDGLDNPLALDMVDLTTTPTTYEIPVPSLLNIDYTALRYAFTAIVGTVYISFVELRVEMADAKATGALSQATPLSGSAIAEAAAGAALTINISLSGAAISAAAASAGLTVSGAGSVDLAGAAAASASASAALTHAVPLSAVSLAVSGASGNLTQLVPLSGSAAAASMATGGLDVSVQLSAAALAQALAAAGLTVDQSGLSADAAGSAGATGTLTLRVNLEGAAVAAAIAAGALSGDGLLTGTPGYRVTRTPRTWKVAA